MLFGDKLEEIRKRQNINTEELARRSGLSIMQIFNLRKNRSQPYLETVIKITKALNVSLDEFSDCDFPQRIFNRKTIGIRKKE